MSTDNFNYKTIKSFEDACKHIGIEPILPVVSALPEDMQKPVIANYKLLIVYKAINNGWKPDWSDHNQYKYFPWFRVLSSGSGFAHSACAYYLSSSSSVGSRLCTDSEEKVMYIAENFEQEYVDCFFYPEKE
jgi:hypothetical protein